MSADEKNAIRFGTGRSPRFPGIAVRPQDVLGDLQATDSMAAAYPIPTFESTIPRAKEYLSLTRKRRKSEQTDTEEARFQALSVAFRADQNRFLATAMARGVESGFGFRERLVWFWADHFTAVGKSLRTRPLVPVFVEEAIRAHLTTRFADMLTAAVLHPVMLMYLDQRYSVGPNSRLAQKHAGKGLNENLAREVLELHTLGVGGRYSQKDVRQLAELFTGLNATPQTGFRFLPNRVEPGAEDVLGIRYGGGKPDLEDIRQVLSDLAIHPDTGRHIARKLAVHFISDTPDPALVEALGQRYMDSGGDLADVYEELLTHPVTQAAPLTKARQPFDFMVAAFRALGISGDTLMAFPNKKIQQRIRFPMRRMGQDWQNPTGPDGWPEEASHWFTPQGLAARINWSMGLRKLGEVDKPDPRELVQTALGPFASEQMVFAAGAAEARADGVGLVLASPEFQRR